MKFPTLVSTLLATAIPVFAATPERDLESGFSDLTPLSADYPSEYPAQVPEKPLDLHPVPTYVTAVEPPARTLTNAEILNGLERLSEAGGNVLRTEDIPNSARRDRVGFSLILAGLSVSTWALLGM